MKAPFCIDYRRSVGNLHIQLAGEFSGQCAWALVKAISLQPLGSGRVFVNTNDLGRVEPGGAALFKSHMSQKKIPRDWLYLKGEKGFGIAPAGSRVIICKKNRHAKPPFLRLCRSKNKIGKSLKPNSKTR